MHGATIKIIHLVKFCTDSKKDIPKHTCCGEWKSGKTIMLSFMRHFLKILRHKIKLTFSKLGKVHTLNMRSVGEI